MPDTPTTPAPVDLAPYGDECEAGLPNVKTDIDTRPTAKRTTITTDLDMSLIISVMLNPRSISLAASIDLADSCASASTF